MKSKVEDLIERERTGAYEVHGDSNDAQCVIAFSFGYGNDAGKNVPGVSNLDMAEFIKDNYPNLPKIMQFEIADALEQTGEVLRIEKHREAGIYLNSLEVARQAKEIMDKKKWESAIIIAHPNHVPRVDAICKKIGIKTITPKGLNSIRFDPESEQEWTRSKELWIEKEIKSINWHAENGWI